MENNEEKELTKQDYLNMQEKPESNYLDMKVSEILEVKDGKKSFQAAYEARFPRIYEMILYEKLTSQELRSAIAKEFKMTERNAEYMVKEARDRLKEKFNERSDEIYQDHLARMFDLLRRCRKDGNKKVERELLADLTKVFGMEQRKLDITSNGEPIQINISIED